MRQLTRTGLARGTSERVDYLFSESSAGLSFRLPQ